MQQLCNHYRTTLSYTLYNSYLTITEQQCSRHSPTVSKFLLTHYYFSHVSNSYVTITKQKYHIRYVTVM